MKLAIIDYGSGNLRSAEKALARVARERGIAADIAVTGDADWIARADRLVLPGVGAFADCMNGLRARPGVIDAMTARIKAGAPFLGICVGMQLLAARGLEHGEHAGLGWIAGDITRITPADPALKIPQMGWNELTFHRPHALAAGIAPGAHAYFVHSYALTAANEADVVSTTDYGGPVIAMVARGNIAGTQFHPEKSQTTGLTLLGNFLLWKP